MPEVWLSYISMEILLGNVKEARSIYRRCYSRRLEGIGTEVLQNSYHFSKILSLLTLAINSFPFQKYFRHCFCYDTASEKVTCAHGFV
jgi:hypothetical protein